MGGSAPSASIYTHQSPIVYINVIGEGAVQIAKYTHMSNLDPSCISMC